MLKWEHRTLDSMLAQFDLRPERAAALRVCDQFALHLRITQWLHAEVNRTAELHGQADDAVEEQEAAELVIGKVRDAGTDAALAEHMAAVRQLVTQHVAGEEKSLFPGLVRGLTRSRLYELGAGLQQTKEDLAAGSTDAPSRSRRQNDQADTEE